MIGPIASSQPDPPRRTGTSPKVPMYARKFLSPPTALPHAFSKAQIFLRVPDNMVQHTEAYILHILNIDICLLIQQHLHNIFTCIKGCLLAPCLFARYFSDKKARGLVLIALNLSIFKFTNPKKHTNPRIMQTKLSEREIRERNNIFRALNTQYTLTITP